MKVLILDADWCFVRQAETYLESHAHLVVHQDRIAGAAERIARWRPDLVILAVELAEGGLLAGLSAMPNRPAVLLAGWADASDAAWRAWQIGGDELLVKPVLGSGELHRAVVAALENAAAGKRRARKLAASA